MITVAQVVRLLPAGTTAKILAEYVGNLDVRSLPLEELKKLRGFNASKFLETVGKIHLAKNDLV